MNAVGIYFLQKCRMAFSTQKLTFFAGCLVLSAAAFSSPAHGLSEQEVTKALLCRHFFENNPRRQLGILFPTREAGLIVRRAMYLMPPVHPGYEETSEQLILEYASEQELTAHPPGPVETQDPAHTLLWPSLSFSAHSFSAVKAFHIRQRESLKSPTVQSTFAVFFSYTKTGETQRDEASRLTLKTQEIRLHVIDLKAGRELWSAVIDSVGTAPIDLQQLILFEQYHRPAAVGVISNNIRDKLSLNLHLFNLSSGSKIGESIIPALKHSISRISAPYTNGGTLDEQVLQINGISYIVNMVNGEIHAP